MDVKSILSLYLNHCGLDSPEVQPNSSDASQTPFIHGEIDLFSSIPLSCDM